MTHLPVIRTPFNTDYHRHIFPLIFVDPLLRYWTSIKRVPEDPSSIQLFLSNCLTRPTVPTRHQQPATKDEIVRRSNWLMDILADYLGLSGQPLIDSLVVATLYSFIAHTYMLYIVAVAAGTLHQMRRAVRRVREFHFQFESPDEMLNMHTRTIRFSSGLRAYSSSSAFVN